MNGIFFFFKLNESKQKEKYHIICNIIKFGLKSGSWFPDGTQNCNFLSKNK